jgi:hypothetical protein
MPSRAHGRYRSIERATSRSRQMAERPLQFVWLTKNVAQEVSHQWCFIRFGSGSRRNRPPTILKKLTCSFVTQPPGFFTAKAICGGHRSSHAGKLWFGSGAGLQSFPVAVSKSSPALS